VTFYRLADHQRGHSLVERDDRVVLPAGWRGGGRPPAPRSCPLHGRGRDAPPRRHLGGDRRRRRVPEHDARERPTSAARGAAVRRATEGVPDRIQRAELIGGFVERLAETPGADVVRLARQSLGTLVNDDVDLAAATRAAAALRQAQERWQSLVVGDQLTVDWPGYRRLVTDG